jgi:hypothetical protein
MEEVELQLAQLHQALAASGEEDKLALLQLIAELKELSGLPLTQSSDSGSPSIAGNPDSTPASLPNGIISNDAAEDEEFRRFKVKPLLIFCILHTCTYICISTRAFISGSRNLGVLSAIGISISIGTISILLY